jgi:hypothetical protein
MSLESARRMLTQLASDARIIPALGLGGAALLVAGILFLVVGGPMQPPAAGSGGVAPLANTGDGDWTKVLGVAFLTLGTLAGLGWTASYAVPRLRGR